MRWAGEGDSRAAAARKAAGARILITQSLPSTIRPKPLIPCGFRTPLSNSVTIQSQTSTCSMDVSDPWRTRPDDLANAEGFDSPGLTTCSQTQCISVACERGTSCSKRRDEC